MSVMRPRMKRKDPLCTLLINTILVISWRANTNSIRIYKEKVVSCVQLRDKVILKLLDLEKQFIQTVQCRGTLWFMKRPHKTATHRFKCSQMPPSVFVSYWSLLSHEDGLLPLDGTYANLSCGGEHFFKNVFPQLCPKQTHIRLHDVNYWMLSIPCLSGQWRESPTRHSWHSQKCQRL